MATTYYVANAGLDTNNGTSTATPFQTGLKAVSVAVAGDTILFKKGDTFTAGLTLSAGVTIDQYGATGYATLTGFKTLTGWVQQPNPNIWAVQDASFGSTLNMLTVDGTFQPRGRMPKAGYNTYTANTGNTSIYDATQAGSYVGGEVVIRKNRFSLDRAPITAMSGGTITYGAGPNNSSANPTPGYGYFIQNHYSCLTQFGDWSYDATNKIIYFYWGTNNPSTHVIQATNIDTLITLNNVSGVTINNVQVIGANKYGVASVGNCSNFTTLATYKLIGIDGINLPYHPYLTVNNSVISNCLNNGLVTPGSSHANIQNNIGNYFGYYPGAGEGGQGSTGWGTHAALIVGANDPAYSFSNTISNNSFSGMGGCGLKLAGDTYTADKNYFENYCSVIDDQAGIYTYTGAAYSYTSRVISNNICNNGVGAPVAPGDTTFAANGIYVDDYSNTVTLSGNTCSNNAQYGIFIHNATGVGMTNNTLYSNGVAQICLVHDSIASSVFLRSLSMTGNKVICTNNTQLAIRFASYYNGSSSDITNWGTASGNYYASTASNTGLFTTQINGNPMSTDTLAQWQAATAQDGDSSIQFITTATRFDFNNSLSTISVSLSNNYMTLDGISEPIGSLSIPAMKSVFSYFVSAPVPTPPTPPTPTPPPAVLLSGPSFRALQGTPIQIDLTKFANTTGWAVDGTNATHIACNAGKMYLLNYPTIPGQPYLISYQVSSISGGYVQPFIGTVGGVQRTTPGYYSETIIGDGTSLYFYSNANVTVTGFNIKNTNNTVNGKAQNTVVFSEKTKKWVSFYTFVPEIGMSMFTSVFTSNNGSIYQHQSGSANRNNLYGTQYNSFIKFVANNSPATIKRFQSINYQSNQLMVTSPGGIQTSLGQVSELISDDFLLDTLNDGVNAIAVYDREGVYSACFMRDMNDDIINGTPLNGNYAVIELQTTNPSTTLKLFTVEVQTSTVKIGSR